ncbi:MAG: hypoxanthine/guanine phosphoribosyltransferase [Candidatus Altiarchaeota archaeon]|nr:hypoxanthine/guanine phosphoribosyltransferase [Candidatus Altiarchaeota archaeon]
MPDQLLKSFRECPVIKRGEYDYFIHPLTDGIPFIDPGLLSEVCDEIARVSDLDVDYILTIESMGIHIASVLSQKTGLPLNIVRKKQYWLPGEIALDQSTGYGKGKLYINCVKKGDRILVVDSVVSTGGTFAVVLEALKNAGAIVKDVVCVVERGVGKKLVKEKTGFEVKTLVKVEVKDGRVHAVRV